MTSPGVDAITDMLDKAHSDGVSVARATEETMGRLNGQIAGMLGRFEGMARVAFEEKHQDWQRQIRLLITELDRIANASKGSAEAQRQLEADSQAAIRSV